VQEVARNLEKSESKAAMGSTFLRHHLCFIPGFRHQTNF
jgi:hypothetical protein